MDEQPMDPDAALMIAVGGDAQDALAELVRRHQVALLNYFARLGGHAESEDLTQETFIRLYRSRRRYRPAARFTTFLYTIARSAWIDHCRKRTRRERMLGYVRLDALVAGETAAARPADRGRHAEVEEALNRLSPKLREVLVLKVYQGLRQQEIADILEVPLGTVKSRLYLALNAIRKVLDETPD